MIYKARVEPNHLVLLKHLQRRMDLSKTDRQLYYNFKRGYEGEIKFDEHFQNLMIDCLILNDLLLKMHNQTFQIDSLLIQNDMIHIFEIKNYAGDYYYENSRLFQKDGSEISNPLLQLERTASLLRQFLLQINVSIPVQAFIVFINPEFTMYQAPLDKPFIFPSQLNRLITKLNSTSLHLEQHHKSLADKLMNAHIKENPFQQLPVYDYTLLRKGIPCPVCHSFYNTILGLKYNCMECGFTERVDFSIVRNAKEFQLLFPHVPLTTNKMLDWCQVQRYYTVQRVLERNFTKVGKKRWLHYV